MPHINGTRIFEMKRSVVVSVRFPDLVTILLPDTDIFFSAEGSIGVLRQSIMSPGLDGWSGVTKHNDLTNVKVEGDRRKGVVGSDNGAEEWYFLAPVGRFSGNLAAAYNGKLSFTLVHAETPSTGHVTRAPDVILEASCGHSLYLYDFATKGGDLSVMLNEDAGWVDSRTHAAPGAIDFLGVLCEPCLSFEYQCIAWS